MNITNFIQPDNPTYEERNTMIKLALEEAKRPEDYDSLVELLSPPQEITNILSLGSGKKAKVGIIGAGVAGLASAFELRKLGFNITIFEMQKERIGGRVYTHYFDKERDLYGELGAMRIPVIHQVTWHYIDTFNLKTSALVQNDENSFIYIRNKRARNDPQGINVMKNIYPEFNLASNEKNKSWQYLISYALENELYNIDPVTRRELIQIKKEYSPKIRALGELSIRKVMELRGLSEGAIELIASINTFLGYFYYNSYVENLQEQYTVDYAFRYYIKGGTSNLPVAFYNSLFSKRPKEYSNIPVNDLGKIQFKMGRSVIEIHENNKNNKVKVCYKNQNESDIDSDEFDYLICALPFSALRDIDLYPMFSTDKIQAIKSLNYTQAQKTVFLCNNRFWEEGKEKIVAGTSTTDLVISTIWYPNNPTISPINFRREKKAKKYERQIPWKNPGVLLASYNLNQDAIRLGNDAQYVDKVKRQVELVHGLPRNYLDPIVEDYRLIQWDQENGFFGAFCYYLPQQQQLFAYSSAKPEYNNKVYFAGEHVGVGHGWMQSSLKSAMDAANDIVEHYKNNFKGDSFSFY